MRKSGNIKNGFSLIEILVTVSIFAVLGVLTTQSLSLTLKGAKKSESMVKVQENINYSLAVIERQIRNAQSVTCPNPSSSVLDYISIEGVATSFTCQSVGNSGYIASGSARLTSNDIGISACTFSCTQSSINTPPVVDVNITAIDPNSNSIERGSISAKTQVIVRNY